MIAHRLSTVTGADQIAVLDGGRVAELGTHEELREAARLARVDDIVERLPHGWHTRIGEAAVQEALTALSADRTVIVIAHRLQTVVAADQIVVLDGGRIVERGSHDELLAHGGRYLDFWRERTRAEGWRLLEGPQSPSRHAGHAGHAARER